MVQPQAVIVLEHWGDWACASPDTSVVKMVDAAVTANRLKVIAIVLLSCCHFRSARFTQLHIRKLLNIVNHCDGGRILTCFVRGIRQRAQGTARDVDVKPRN